MTFQLIYWICQWPSFRNITNIQMFCSGTCLFRLLEITRLVQSVCLFAAVTAKLSLFWRFWETWLRVYMDKEVATYTSDLLCTVVQRRTKTGETCCDFRAVQWEERVLQLPDLISLSNLVSCVHVNVLIVSCGFLKSGVCNPRPWLRKPDLWGMGYLYIWWCAPPPPSLKVWTPSLPSSDTEASVRW